MKTTTAKKFWAGLDGCSRGGRRGVWSVIGFRRFLGTIGLVGAACFWGGITPVRAAENALQSTRAAMEKWVEAKQTIARTRADWITEKETLHNTLDLFRKELEGLEFQMANVRTNVSEVQKEMTELDYEKALLGAALDRARLLVTALESNVLRLEAQLPVPLVSTVRPLLQKIPEDSLDTKRSVMERMQNVVGIINEVDKFNRAVKVESEVQQNPSGADVQVRTLYLGLGQAFFVDKSGQYAGVGVPTEEGWNWVNKPELGPTVLRAIGIYENTEPAGFVGLPVEIK